MDCFLLLEAQNQYMRTASTIRLPRSKSSQSKLWNYWRVGYLLHGIGVVSLWLAFLIAHFVITTWSDDQLVLGVFLSWLSSFFFMNAIFSQLDAYSRYQNFKQIRDQFYIHGFQPRLANTLQKSKCQRLAALKAAEDTGIAEEVAQHYHANGYRWYHVLPDFVFKNPLFFFHPYFWRSTFFVKRYKTRYFQED